MLCTPIVDPNHDEWKTPMEQGKLVTSWFEQYEAPAWKELAWKEPAWMCRPGRSSR